jgi:glycosyltransferase involved in cell wall biosynthesis
MKTHAMTSIPETSIVVTCYNYGRYLKGCLESILGQTYTDWEIIVIDDGSADNTPEVMAGFAGHAGIRYIRQRNGGQARAKNRGIEAAKGRFIAFLDADDLWEKDKLEKQLPLFSADSVGVVFSRSRFIGANGEDLGLPETGKNRAPRRGKVTEFLYIDNFIPFSSSIVRRECLERCSRFDASLKMGIDWDLWLRISVAYTFDFVDAPLLIYRVGHSGQMSHNLEERQRCSDRIMHRFRQNFPGTLSRRTLRKADYHTFCNRGEYYADKDRWRSIRFFGRAIKTDPLQMRAFKRLVKLLFKALPVASRR